MLSNMHATLPAADIDRARKFYSETLGFAIKDEREDGIRFIAGQDEFLVYESQYAGTNKATAAAVTVEDLEATLGKLRAAGVEILEYDFEEFKTVNGIAETPGGKGAWIKDSEGNIIGLGEWEM